MIFDDLIELILTNIDDFRDFYNIYRVSKKFNKIIKIVGKKKLFGKDYNKKRCVTDIQKNLKYENLINNLKYEYTVNNSKYRNVHINTFGINNINEEYIDFELIFYTGTYLNNKYYDQLIISGQQIFYTPKNAYYYIYYLLFKKDILLCKGCKKCVDKINHYIWKFDDKYESPYEKELNENSKFTFDLRPGKHYPSGFGTSISRASDLYRKDTNIKIYGENLKIFKKINYLI